MAAKYRKIFTRIWTDEKFIRLNALQKLVALYVLTSDQTNRIGIYRLSGALAIEETGMRDFPKRFLEVTKLMEWGWDTQTKLVYIPSWWKWNPPENKNSLLGASRDIDDVPYCRLIEDFADNVKYLPEQLSKCFKEIMAVLLYGPSGVGLRNRTDTLSKPSRTQYQYQEQEQEQKQEGFGSPSLFDTPDKTANPVDSGTVDSAAMDLAAVRRVWAYYLEKCGKNARLMDFSELRRNKGLARFAEAKRKAGGDSGKAEKLMCLAVDSLAASDFHMGRDAKTNGKRYDKWEQNLFNSLERFEGWLEQAQ